jgi:glycosyltransferase involved in cell wall biosynthesis
MRRIAALVPYALGTSPGQHVRIESWARYLEQSNWVIDFYPFEDSELHDVLYRPRMLFLKAKRLLSCYARQLRRIASGPPCDAIFIYKEAALVGPALLERLATRLRVPIIYDLDDPFFLSYRSPFNGWLSLLKFSGKTHSLFRLSGRVIAVNSLLANYARAYNPSVSVIPNCVDVDRYQPRPRDANGTVRLVWIGSQSTLSNVPRIAEPLHRLQRTHQVPLHIIGAGYTDLREVEATCQPWAVSTEVGDLQACDIGLLPIADSAWNEWKFPFKAIQYMAVGLPVVADRIGPITDIVEDGVNGFLVDTTEEWHERLETLVTDREVREAMGQSARATVVERFSFGAQMPNVASVFEEVCSKAASGGEAGGT